MALAGVVVNGDERECLRRELGWPHTDFYTCGHWLFDADKWNRRYEATGL